MFASNAEARRAGWFSRRHQTADAQNQERFERDEAKKLDAKAREDRLKLWGSMTTEQKVTSLKARRGESKRQMKKLTGVS